MTTIDPSYQISPGTSNISNAVVTLDSQGRLPAVDGSQLQNLNLSNDIGIVAVSNGGTSLAQLPAVGQLLIGNSNSRYTLNTLSTNGDIFVQSGSGSITLSLPATGVTSGTYGDATHVPQITVTSKGLLTSVANVTISAGSSGGWNRIYNNTSASLATNGNPLSITLPDNPGTYRVEFRLAQIVASGHIGLTFNSDSNTLNYSWVKFGVNSSTGFQQIVATIGSFGQFYISHLANNQGLNSHLDGSLYIKNNDAGYVDILSLSTWSNGANNSTGTISSETGTGTYAAAATTIQFQVDGGTLAGNIQVWERTPA